MLALKHAYIGIYGIAMQSVQHARWHLLFVAATSAVLTAEEWQWRKQSLIAQCETVQLLHILRNAKAVQQCTTYNKQ